MKPAILRDAGRSYDMQHRIYCCHGAGMAAHACILERVRAKRDSVIRIQSDVGRLPPCPELDVPGDFTLMCSYQESAVWMRQGRLFSFWRRNLIAISRSLLE